MDRKIDTIADEAKQGDTESMRELIDRMYPLISSNIAKGGWRLEDRDDLLQDGRLEIICAVREFDPERKVPVLGYLKSRIKYLYLGRKRDPVVASLNVTYGEDDDEFINTLQSEEDILEDILDSESYDELKQAISELPTMQKHIITDLYFNGYSLSQTAEMYGIAYRTVVNTRAQALKNLRAYLRRED
ncbi:MAG: sigma-70 family RNA polymerase sigma factor [Gudongella sp.]|jgi:RNA polymerase sporulation-specific sigma factor|nr:sigma-70 family RNA polymerase sigma factor [Gudongella sp.]